MAVAEMIVDAAIALWAAFVVFRLETLRKNHKELWERVIAIEQALRNDGEP